MVKINNLDKITGGRITRVDFPPYEYIPATTLYFVTDNRTGIELDYFRSSRRAIAYNAIHHIRQFFHII